MNNFPAHFKHNKVISLKRECRSKNRRQSLKIRCNEELSRLTRVEKAVKNTTIIVIYKVLVYIQMSWTTTCFGLY